ncbi:LOW QUALITY PROTEIN: hypothetical protein HZS_6179 [Henneguya salminicola]|nr:LOW QUALITY PROTEIN: hypothetical protein HZS_6179 [Henneguya salminicola]
MNMLQYTASDSYRNLIILSETLPRMSDTDRKIEIIKFAKENRSLYVRLLAVTQWANTSQFYEQAESILNKVELHSSAFIHTADMLYQMSKVQLPNCTIPLPCVVVAADVLSTGSYNRLPQCFFDFTQKEPPAINENQIKARISENILDVLATQDFENYLDVNYNQDYISLKNARFSIDITTLNDDRGKL